MLYTVPTDYNIVLTICQGFSAGSTCSVYMALFGINIADMAILADFSIVF